MDLGEVRQLEPQTPATGWLGEHLAGSPYPSRDTSSKDAFQKLGWLQTVVEQRQNDRADNTG